MIRHRDIEAATAALAGLGLDIAEDAMPPRFVLCARDGRRIDVHPITFDARGTAWPTAAGPDGSDCDYPFYGFTTGGVAGVAVSCLSARVEFEHRLGYEPRPHDLEDMTRLATAYGLSLPPTHRDE